ncbi:MAG TPA: PQQ-dependent sugar dehydrogenase [Ignavibacteria bacterium]|nr:PQQ-dependent sugar dehydrogenase [Ignavibacteria bacterium]
MKKYIFIAVLVITLASGSSYSQYLIKDAFPNLTFAYPIEMVTPGDGTNRLFLLEKGGKVIVFENNTNVTTKKTFLDITDRVSQYFYAGLFGIAFHPDYESNRYFYLYYMSGTGATLTLHLSRFTASATNPDSALKESELDILTAPCPSSNHNGSVIKFGPDGYLYFAFGDSSPGSGGDPENKAQNRAQLFGKVHRINIDSASGGRNYSIPATNPYYQNTSGFREEIFAYGFRNIWKFNFDQVTGKLWLADVGQVSWEEIDIVEAGKNYGWRRKEGFVCYNPSVNCDTSGFTPTDPLYAYSHSVGSSIAGGYVYRGSKMPGLYGKYIYADYTSGRIWALSWDGINPPANTELFDTPYGVVSFAEDTAKNLYFIHFVASAGKVYKIIDSTVTTSDPLNESVPSDYKLYQNYPNPFNPVTHLGFGISKLGYVSLKVFDVLGNEIKTLINEIKPAGYYDAEFNGSNLPSGIYYYRIEAGEFIETRKMILLK